MRNEHMNDPYTPEQNRGGPTITGSRTPAAPRLGGHSRQSGEYDQDLDRRSHQQWVDGATPEPFDATTTRPAGMSLWAWERSAERVESFFRELEPEDRELLDACMSFRGVDRQAARFLGLPLMTYRDRLSRARQRAKVALVKHFEWGDEPVEYTERLNEVRREQGEREFKVRNDRTTALAAYQRTGSLRAAARELNVSKSSLQRLLNAA
jgi:hypothetical protein